MKEYKVMAKVKGKWYPAHMPNNPHCGTHKTLEEAEARVAMLRDGWDRYVIDFPTLSRAYVPTDFKIVVRYISEWEDVNENLGNTKCPYNGSIRCGDGEKCYEGGCSV